MIIIQSTKKLATELKLALSEVPLSAFQSIYGWHANLFFCKRNKCVLIMNNQSRYNFVIYGIVKADFKRFNSIILEHIQMNLLKDGLNQTQIANYINDHTEVIYTPTSDRSILSQINEMIMVGGYELERNLHDFNDPKVDAVNQMLNRYLFLKLPKYYSGETMMSAMQELDKANDGLRKAE